MKIYEIVLGQMSELFVVYIESHQTTISSFFLYDRPIESLYDS